MSLVARLQMLLVIVSSCAANLLVAQPPGDIGVWRITAEGRERFVYPGDRSARTPWTPTGTPSMTPDSVVVDPASRATIVYLHLSGYPSNRWLSLRRAANGAISVNGVSPAPPVDPADPMADERRTNAVEAFQPAASRDFLGNGLLDALELHPFLLDRAPRSATELHLTLAMGERRRTLQGRVFSRSVGDTSIAGGAFAIVRDSIALEVALDEPRWERTLFANIATTHRLRGYTIARRYVDPTLGWSTRIVDTTTLDGTETRRFPDGRVFSTPLRYERTRVIAVVDSLEARRRREKLVSEYDLGVVMRPPLTPPTGPDLGSAAVRDSILSVHDTSTRVAQRDSIESLLGRSMLQGVNDRLIRNNLAHGDTAAALRLVHIEYPGRLDESRYRLIRPLLDDPAVAMRYGISTNEWYEAFEYGFKYFPVAVARDTSRMWCLPEACTLVAEEWMRAREPRLRNVGLMARFSMDPARWADTVIRVARGGVRQLDAMRRLAEGIRVQRVGEPELPIPAPDADWHEWKDWLRGGSDATLARRDSIDRARNVPRVPGDRSTFIPLPISFTNTDHELAIASVRRGVSYRDALAQRFREATTDSTRIVFGGLAMALGEPVRAWPAVMASLQSESRLDHDLGRYEVTRLRYTRAPDSIAAAIRMVLVDALLDSTPLWPALHPLPHPRSGFARVQRPDSTHVVADLLPPRALARLQSAGIAVHPSTWRLPNEASGRVITLGRVQIHGDFAMVSWGDGDLIRLPDGRGGGGGSGGRYYLARIEGKWYVVVDEWLYD